MGPALRYLVVLSSLVVCRLGWAADQKLDYNRDVRPILSENCFACHGFDEKARQADLRLDNADEVYADRGGTTPITAGKPEASEVWKRIVSQDPDEKMPPPKSHLELSQAEKETIKRWIEEGATYAGHWAFIPPKKIAPPSTKESPIDAFVEARLNEMGWTHSPTADRGTLIRRLSLDLTGLPPSAEEVKAFVEDDAADAYLRLVERLLDSPHFGERMAMEWLDAARYADTNGFSIDGGRHMWLWRDWVIQAWNDNMPYDRFLVEQIAGDLLPDCTDGQRIATGFQRNNMVTHEGGTIPEENLVNYNADRVKTMGEAILGLTLGCAQCHDHKFDPISQREYYQLFAFYNTLSDRGLDGNGGVNPGPSIQARTVLRTEELESLKASIAAVEAKLGTLDKVLLARWEDQVQQRLKRRGQDLRLHPVKTTKISTPNRGAGFEIEEDRLVRLSGAAGLAAFDILSELPPIDEPITGLRVIMHPVAELPGGGWGAGPDDRPRGRKNDEEAKPQFKGSFMLTALAVTVDKVPSDQVNLFKLLSIAQTTANSWDLQHPPTDCLDPRNESGWSPDLKSQGPVHLTATFAEPIDARATPYLTVQLNFGNGRSLIPGLVEFQVLTGHDDGTDLRPEILAILEKSPSTRSEEETALLWQECRNRAEDLAASRIDLANLRERLDVLTQSFPTMVMDVAEKPRETYVLHRGDYLQPTDRVEAGTPSVLPPLPEGGQRDRLALAHWLVANDHPLTSRVAVNRFWKLLFGRGLVATSADFGSQGEWPTHPELLDWLAVEFVERGWNVKELIKQIVLSKTYQQSSIATAEHLERDPQNRWLARGPRYRMSAEMIRDTALKISGLLVPRLGGPSVHPYMPSDLWREVSHYGSTPATAQTYVQDHGEKLYRRSLYTFWKRTAPPPNMVAFDAPNREVCTVERGKTITPLQALVTLNDVQFVEAARAFATRILRHPTNNDEARMRWAFVEATAREPSEAERLILHRRLEKERVRYRDRKDVALVAIAVGESPLPADIPQDELAAWSQIASLLLNLSETLTRE